LCHNLHHINMAETTPPTPTPEPWLSASMLRRLITAFLVALAIWNFLISLTNDLILPLLAGAMAGNQSSPSQLGRTTVNAAGLFSAIVEFCLTGLVAAALSYRPRRRVRVVRKVVRVNRAAAKAATVTPTTASQPSMATTTPNLVAASPVHSSKPVAPKEVFYNIVGEPINPTEDE
jgi:hypothetical protein